MQSSASACKPASRRIVFVFAAAAFGQNRDAEFNQLADRFFDEAMLRFDPVAGTAWGFHQYDNQLSSESSAEIQAQIAALHKFEGEVQSFDPRELSPFVTSDRELMLAQIHGTLLSLETIRAWEKNPDNYSSGVTNAIFVIMSRNFAPAPDRLKSVIARERLIPRVFQSARENLKNPPKIYTEVALEQIPGIVSFFQSDVPKAFESVTDKPLLAEFKKTNVTVIDALNSYQAYLKNDLLPRSHGDFRIGADTYAKKLMYDEMVDTPVADLLKLGYLDLRRNQESFKRVAGQIDPKRTPQQILEESERDHPPADKLMESFRGVLGGLRDFIQQHPIVTIPSPVLPIVEETPPFMRELTTASMDTPGPYEEVAKEAYFNVTLPDPVGPPKKWKSISRASIAARLSAPQSTKCIPATTRSFCGCGGFQPRSGSCWDAHRTPKVGPTIPNR